jgi:TRAP-type mannitol/chloroaromatic compound transport system permease small subunit
MRLIATMACIVDQVVDRVLSWSKWLIVPVVVMLFLQWPLREIFKAYSREANDLGQWIFALYVAACFTSATRAGTHLRADMLARTYSERVRQLLRCLGIACGLLPWALYVLVSARSIVVVSIAGLEAFPDTANPGYFLIKASLWVLAALVLAQGLIDLTRPLSPASD